MRFSASQTSARIEYLRASGNSVTKKALLVLNFLLNILQFKLKATYAIKQRQDKLYASSHYQAQLEKCSLPKELNPYFEKLTIYVSFLGL